MDQMQRAVICRGKQGKRAVQLCAQKRFGQQLAACCQTGQSVYGNVHLIGRMGVVGAGTQSRENGMVFENKAVLRHAVTDDLSTSEARHFNIVGMCLTRNDIPGNRMTVSDDLPA